MLEENNMKTKYFISMLLIIAVMLCMAVIANAEVTYDATLSWSSNSEENLIGYKIYRSEQSGTYGEPIGVIEKMDSPEYVNTIDINKVYYYVVTAYNKFGESPFSNEVSINTSVPCAPVSVTVTITISITQ